MKKWFNRASYPVHGFALLPVTAMAESPEAQWIEPSITQTCIIIRDT